MGMLVYMCVDGDVMFGIEMGMLYMRVDGGVMFGKKSNYYTKPAHNLHFLTYSILCSITIHAIISAQLIVCCSTTVNLGLLLRTTKRIRPVTCRIRI